MCECKNENGKMSCSGHDHNFGHIFIKVLAGILLSYLIVYVGTLARNNVKKFNFIGKAERMQNTISVSGEGKVTGTPNIAVTEIGLLTEKADVASAQKENSEKMNKLISEVKKLGIKDEDIQTTQYSIYPKYDYTDGRNILSGYTVQQSVTVKIRDLTKINTVLAKVGEVGANQVSSLSFTIDDKEALRASARELALKNVQEKAVALARALGVRLVRVVSFNESSGNDVGLKNYPLYAEGIGGGGVPDIQTGSLDIKVNANVVYEIE
ncbi:MAG: SIMPL domain-containing protein [Candidatus Magasanikbacteria bacterium]|nr:SIMPL domain-containing protein [Candidatus Magasanikbacteria bacterium]